MCDPIYCNRCDALLDPKKAVWLEFNNAEGTYHKPEDNAVPEEDSLGVYPFGSDCARRALRGED